MKHKLMWLIILQIGIFQLALADTVEPIRSISGDSREINSIAISKDGRYILTGSYGMKMWDTSSWDEIGTFQKHSNYVASVAFSQDGRYVLSGSTDKTMKLWEVSSEEENTIIFKVNSEVYSVALSPDGRYALSGCGDKTMKLWDVSSGEEIRTYKGNGRVSSVTFSPDGRYILSGSEDKTMKLSETDKGGYIRIYKGHESYVYAVAFSPDGRYALSGSADKTMKLWDVSSKKEIRTFKGHKKSVFAVAFSPNGNYILSGSEDKTMILWDISSGKKIRTFKGHEGSVSSVAFSPDGNYVYSGSHDKTLKVWESGIGVINPPPQAVFTMKPNTGVAPLTVQLDASTSTDDGNIVKYQWTSSDKQTAEGVKASLKFSQAGKYDITLTVTDNKGATATKTQTITVNAKTEEPNKPTTEEPNQPTTEESNTTAQIQFEDLKTFYKVGETLSVNLVQKVQTNRFQRVDLWAMIEMPTGKMIYNTPLPFAPFSYKPQPFQKSLETSSKKQKILDFEIPPGLGGSYVFYGVYLKEGSNLEQDGIMALRSNVAQKKITLADK